MQNDSTEKSHLILRVTQDYLQVDIPFFCFSFIGNKKQALDLYKKGVKELEAGIAVDCSKEGLYY